MGLVRAERRRLFKRRFTRYMLLIGVLILAAVAVGVYATHQKPGAAASAEAQQRADAMYQQILADAERERAECVRAKESNSAGAEMYPPDCEMIQPPPREIVEGWTAPPSFDFRQTFPIMITVFTAILVLVSFVIGSSYIGAEWNSGAMMNLLLWRPRRLQVLLTKLGVLLASLTGVFVALGAVWTAAFWAIATYRGTTAEMTPGVWESFALMGGRGLALVLAAGAVGFAVASIGRHTAMALGAAIGLVVVGQFGLGIALGIAQAPFLEAWLFPTYVAAWMFQETTVEDFRSCEFAMGECRPAVLEITWQHSALLFGSVTVLALVAAAWSLRRRDIT